MSQRRVSVRFLIADPFRLFVLNAMASHDQLSHRIPPTIFSYCVARARTRGFTSLNRSFSKPLAANTPDVTLAGASLWNWSTTSASPRSTAIAVTCHTPKSSRCEAFRTRRAKDAAHVGAPASSRRTGDLDLRRRVAATGAGGCNNAIPCWACEPGAAGRRLVDGVDMPWQHRDPVVVVSAYRQVLLGAALHPVQEKLVKVHITRVRERRQKHIVASLPSHGQLRILVENRLRGGKVAHHEMLRDLVQQRTWRYCAPRTLHLSTTTRAGRSHDHV